MKTASIHAKPGIAAVACLALSEAVITQPDRGSRRRGYEAVLRLLIERSDVDPDFKDNVVHGYMDGEVVRSPEINSGVTLRIM